MTKVDFEIFLLRVEEKLGFSGSMDSMDRLDWDKEAIKEEIFQKY